MPRYVTLLATAVAGMVLSAAQAPTAVGSSSGGVVSNGTVQLGVNSTGDLNYACGAEDAGCPGASAGGAGSVGLRYVPLNLESIAPGCACEGWGVADAGTGLTGSANQSAGIDNVTVNSFTRSADGTTAISDVTIADPTKPGAQMRVVQNYHPSAVSANLYENTVTVTNTGTVDFVDLRYRRVMDWDIEPTAFAEWSTSRGTSPQLLFNSDEGFAPADPLAGLSYNESEAVCGNGYTGPCEFEDLGLDGIYPTVTQPDDHGVLYDFGFGALADGASKSFTLYYGAAPSEATALSALSSGGAQVYSLGQSNCPNGPSTAGCNGLAAGAGPAQGQPATFMLGFVTTSGDLSVTKTDSPEPVTVGQDLTYTLTVYNNGPAAAAGVVVRDELPAGVNFESATPSAGGSCSGSTTVQCSFASIANNGSATVTIVVTPTVAGALSNTATVRSASGDPVPANNSDAEVTTVTPAATVVGTTNDDPPSTGEQPATSADPVAAPGIDSPGTVLDPDGLLDATDPVLRSLAIRPARFLAAVTGGPVGRAKARGARVSYVLSEAAIVTFTLQRRRPGRRVGRRCVAPTRANRTSPRCVRYELVGRFSHAGGPGSNAFRFTGRIGGRTLPPGRYQMRAVARDLRGNRSGRRTLAFTILSSRAQ